MFATRTSNYLARRSGFGWDEELGIAAALFAWLGFLVPYGMGITFSAPWSGPPLVGQLISWLLAAAVMAWWLGRQERRRPD